MKPKWQLRLNGLSESPASKSSQMSSPIISPNTPKKTRHLSLHGEKVSAKKMKAKKMEIEKAVKYCRDNNCNGYKTITELGRVYVKDPQTINQHLQGKVVTGDEKKEH